MPRVELKDQSDIIATIKKEGGYARKWASAPFQVGVPDLVCALPDIGLFLLEVKTVGNYEPTPKQLFELNAYEQGGGKCFLGIVVRRSEVLLRSNFRDTGICIRWDSTTQSYRGMKERMIQWLNRNEK